MKLKNRTIFKTALTLIALCLLISGWIGFMTSAPSSRGKAGIEKYYDQHPLNDKTGIVVDSNGNIYIGEGQTGSIQVYDSLGNFQYGFGFPVSGGSFTFGIEQDKIHLVTARTQSYFIIDRGKLVSSEDGIDYDRKKDLKKQYHMKQDNSYVTNNKIYKISSFNTVSITDEVNGKVDKIHLNVPIWPFPVAVFWGIGAVGMGLLFALHHKFLFPMNKRIKEK